MSFSQDFVWGAASAAYQIEGAWNEDGKGPSIWDEFSHWPGTIKNGDNGDVACDSYHLYMQDLQILQDMGLHAYRFSISWPRIFPEGDGKLNQKGLDYYDALVDAMLKKGITPYATLFHWDLPLSLHQRGGWLARRTAREFADYAAYIAAHFDGRIQNYFTINEPQCIVELGYQKGLHAPGLRLPPGRQAECMHNLLLAHGLSVQAIRGASSRPVNIGIASTGRLCYPPEDTPDAREAARSASFTLNPNDWVFTHQWFLDAAVLGGYPADVPPFLKEFADSVPPDDFKIIKQDLDFLGVNVYNGTPVDTRGKKAAPYPGFPRTAMKWPVTPEVMHYGPLWLYDRYRLPIYITENGQSCNDRIFLDTCVHDVDRIDFLARYLTELKKAAAEGAPLLGYFHWSLTDNFEWNNGYGERFGLVYIDYPTQKRIPKDSCLWFAATAKKNGENL
jgi:beta-glucosidase